MSSESKIITELTSYTAAEVSASGGTDLLFIADLANNELKKISASELSDYMFRSGSSLIRTGSFSGNLYGTASWSNSSSIALTSITSSYALNSPGTLSSGANVGTGSNLYNVYDSTTGTTLRFKSIIAGSNITLTEDVANKTLQISATSTNTNNTNIVSVSGATKSVQFNNNGVLDGTIAFRYELATGQLTATPVTPGTVSFVGTSSAAISSSYSDAAFSSISSSYALSSSYASVAGTALTLSSGAGVKQITATTRTTEISWTGTTAHQTGFLVTVTPSNSANKYIINVDAQFSIYIGGWSGAGAVIPITYYLKRTVATTPSATETTLQTGTMYVTTITSGLHNQYATGVANLIKTWTDEPATTLAVTYELYITNADGRLWTNYINSGGVGISTIIATEY